MSSITYTYLTHIQDVGADCTSSIVAVSGLGAAASQPWLDGQVNWLGDEAMLPYWLPTARIMHVTYDWAWFGQDNAIQHWLPLLARELLKAVMTKRQHCPTRPVIFIGHSFGGLIIKKVGLPLATMLAVDPDPTQPDLPRPL